MYVKNFTVLSSIKNAQKRKLVPFFCVAQNKPDYLLLLSKLCISTTKHVTVIMYVQHQEQVCRTFFHVLNISNSTTIVKKLLNCAPQME